ncbi:MAG: tellurite resistance/C4-dicarboxylate transporter family protein [Candidatus Dormibacteria bacterium]
MPPASGAVVMGTGIVALGLRLDHQALLSHLVLALAGAVWCVLGAVLLLRVLTGREGLQAEAHSPAALTGVAGSAVLGTALTLIGWIWAGGALLALSTGLWLILIGPVTGHWTTPTVGVSFMVTVATESLAVLAATVAATSGSTWLLGAAVVPWALGLAAYLLVLSRFDLGQLTSGRGDHWVSGGALAISALASGRLTLAAAAAGWPHQLVRDLAVVALGVWVAAMAWLPALLLAEAVRPRLAYDLRRWATVFPVGMYAACSFIVGQAAGLAVLERFAGVWVWVGVLVWLLVLVPTLQRALSSVRALF